MNRSRLLLLCVLSACEASTVSSPPGPGDASSVNPVGEASTAPALFAQVPSQVVTIDCGGVTAQAQFSGYIAVGGESGPAQMDGAILVVSAVDGPMPFTCGGGLRLLIDLPSLTIDAGNVIQVEGAATTYDRLGEPRSIPIAGAIRFRAGDKGAQILELALSGERFELALEAIARVTGPEA